MKKRTGRDFAAEAKRLSEGDTRSSPFGGLNITRRSVSATWLSDVADHIERLERRNSGVRSRTD